MFSSPTPKLLLCIFILQRKDGLGCSQSYEFYACPHLLSIVHVFLFRTALLKLPIYLFNLFRIPRSSTTSSILWEKKKPLGFPADISFSWYWDSYVCHDEKLVFGTYFMINWKIIFISSYFISSIHLCPKGRNSCVILTPQFLSENFIW